MLTMLGLCLVSQGGRRRKVGNQRLQRSFNSYMGHIEWQGSLFHFLSQKLRSVSIVIFMAAAFLRRGQEVRL
jgi:hypothetical protein